ncbi:hypothetical protein ACVILE_001713 [Streptomyces sp. M18.1]
MRPTLAAAQLRGSLTQYLTTPYALTDEDTRRALERFLEHSETGMFRGPYLRIRTPFYKADAGREKHQQWNPGFTPHRHQAKAYERASRARPANTGHHGGRAPGRPSRFSPPSATTAAARRYSVGAGSRPCCSTR